MSFVRLITATTLAAACTLGFAQGASTPAKKDLVQKVLLLQQPSFDALARGLAEQSIAPLGQQVGAVMQNRVAPEQREATARDLQAEFKKYGDEVIPLLRERATKLAPSAVGPVLEDKLSEDELKQLVTMLEAPIYRKYQSLGGEMQKALMDKVVADTRPIVEPKLKALQESVAKRLGLEAPAAGGAKKPAASAPAKSAASAAKK